MRKAFLNRLIRISWSVARACFLIGMGYVLLFPLLTLLSNSFRSPLDMIDPSVIWIPKSLTMDHIRTAWEQIDYPNVVKNTLLVGIVSALLQIATCCMVGYGFARFRFKGRNLLFTLVLLTIIVPPQTVIIPLYLQYRFFDLFGLLTVYNSLTGSDASINLLNTGWTFYLPSILGVGLRSGLFIYIFRQFFKGMSNELENAAKIDGCGPFVTFIRVMAPNALPAFLTVFLFSIVWHWNDFALSSIFFKTQGQFISGALANTLAVTFAQMVSSDVATQMAVLNAGSLLAIIPPLMIYMMAQRYFIESVERTGIKG